MTTTIIIISIYIALVFIGYGMILQNKHSELNFITAALIIWVTVPFLILIIFGRWINSLSDKLNNELNNE